MFANNALVGGGVRVWIRLRHHSVQRLLRCARGIHCKYVHLVFTVQLNYSGTSLNGHILTADTYDITDNSESPNSPSIHFNT